MFVPVMVLAILTRVITGLLSIHIHHTLDNQRIIDHPTTITTPIITDLHHLVRPIIKTTQTITITTIDPLIQTDHNTIITTSTTTGTILITPTIIIVPLIIPNHHTTVHLETVPQRTTFLIDLLIIVPQKETLASTIDLAQDLTIPDLRKDTVLEKWKVLHPDLHHRSVSLIDQVTQADLILKVQVKVQKDHPDLLVKITDAKVIYSSSQKKVDSISGINLFA